MTVPLFALANAGIAIDGDFLERAADSPITLGVLVGYAAGKPLGVVGTALLVRWLSRGRLRPTAGWGAVAGAGAGASAGGSGTCRSQTWILAPSWRHWPRRPPPIRARSGRWTNQLLEHQDKLRMADLVSYADRLGLDVARFTEDLRGHVGAKRIAQDGEGADRVRVSGTPTFFINGHRHHGAYDMDTLSQSAPPAAVPSWRRRSAHVPCRLRAILAIRLRPPRARPRLVRAGRSGQACPQDLREFAPGPVQALAIHEEGRRRVDSSSPAALDVGEDALSKRVFTKGRVGLR